MKRLKTALCVFLSLLVLASPFAAVLYVSVFAPPQYSNTFVGALDEKFERLNSIEEDKIVIIGGSSVAFGIDSELIEKYTDMPVVNFGLYATLGTKLMLDLSRSGIKRGDIVIISPELNSQTYSLYFNSEATLRALDGNFSMLEYVDGDNIPSLVGGAWSFAQDKLGYLLDGNSPDPEGIYNAKSFNEYGDIAYPRSENIMVGYYDENTMIDPDADIITDEFVDYINEYVDFCEGRGATVYFGFCPMNTRGIVADSTREDFDEFQRALDERLDCKLISPNINKYIYHEGYFYDTNFHLNDAGVRCHTLNLLSDILLELSIPKLPSEKVPDPPELPGVDVSWSGECENTEYFTFERASNGAYTVTGLTSLGKKQKTLTLPLGYDGYKVMYIGESAFSGGVVTTLVIPEDTNIRVIKSGAFLGAGKLTDMWIYYPKEEDILPPSDFKGVSSDFVVHIPDESYYESGYYWGERGLTFERDIK